jgi:hypothetical protein
VARVQNVVHAGSRCHRSTFCTVEVQNVGGAPETRRSSTFCTYRRASGNAHNVDERPRRAARSTLWSPERPKRRQQRATTNSGDVLVAPRSATRGHAPHSMPAVRGAPSAEALRAARLPAARPVAAGRSRRAERGRAPRCTPRAAASRSLPAVPGAASARDDRQGPPEG